MPNIPNKDKGVENKIPNDLLDKVKKFFGELGENEIFLRAQRIYEKLDKNPDGTLKEVLEELKWRGDNVEVHTSSRNNLLATSTFESWLTEGYTGRTMGNNATGHYLPSSSSGPY